MQDRAIVNLALNRANGDISLAQTIYRELTGYSLNAQFARSVHDTNHWRNPISPGEVLRIEGLANGMRTYSTHAALESQFLGNAERIILSRLGALQQFADPVGSVNHFLRGLEESTSETGTSSLMRTLFPNGMPLNIERMYHEWRQARLNGTQFTRHAELRQLLIGHLSNRLTQVRSQHTELIAQYANTSIEREAVVGERNLALAVAHDLSTNLSTMLENRSANEQIHHITVEQWREIHDVLRQGLNGNPPNVERVAELSRLIQRMRQGEFPPALAGELASLIHATRSLPGDVVIPFDRLSSSARSAHDVRLYRETLQDLVSQVQDATLRRAGIDLLNELVRGISSGAHENIRNTMRTFMTMDVAHREVILQGLSRNLLSPTSLRSIMEMSQQGRQSISELLRLNMIADAATLNRLVNNGDIVVLARAVEAGILNQNTLADAAVLRGRPAEEFLALLREQIALPREARMTNELLRTRLEQLARQTILEQIGDWFSDNTISRQNFEHLFTQFNDADRTVALEIMRQCSGNLRSQSLNDSISSIADQLLANGVAGLPVRTNPNSNREIPYITVLVPNSDSMGNLLAHLLLCHLRTRGVELRIETVSYNRQMESLASSGVLNNAVVLDNLASFSATQQTYLRHAQDLRVVDIPALNNGINVLDLASTSNLGTAAVQQRLNDLVHHVVELQTNNPQLLVNQAVSQVLNSNVAAPLEHLRLSGARVVSPSSTHNLGIVNGSNTAVLNQLFEYINRPLTSTAEVDGFLSLIGRDHVNVAAQILRDGVVFNSYSTIMMQTRDLHTQILQRIRSANPNSGTENVLIVTGLQPDGSSYLVNHLYARTNGLGPQNFISHAELIAIRDHIQDNTQMPLHLRNRFEQLRNSTLVFLDDYINSGSQSAELVSNLQTEVLRHIVGSDGRPVVTNMVVGSLGRYDVGLDSATNPWHPHNTDPRFQGLRQQSFQVGLLHARSFAGFNSQQYLAQTGLGSNSPEQLSFIGQGACWRDSSVQTTIVTPYGGPNNNVRFIQAFIDGFSTSHRGPLIPGGILLPQRYSNLNYNPPTGNSP